MTILNNEVLFQASTILDRRSIQSFKEWNQPTKIEHHRFYSKKINYISREKDEYISCIVLSDSSISNTIESDLNLACSLAYVLKTDSANFYTRTNIESALCQIKTDIGYLIIKLNNLYFKLNEANIANYQDPIFIYTEYNFQKNQSRIEFLQYFEQHKEEIEHIIKQKKEINTEQSGARPKEYIMHNQQKEVIKKGCNIIEKENKLRESMRTKNKQIKQNDFNILLHNLKMKYKMNSIAETERINDDQQDINVKELINNYEINDNNKINEDLNQICDNLINRQEANINEIIKESNNLIASLKADIQLKNLNN